jgi:hypothetical protein
MKTKLWVILAMLTLQASAQNIVSNGSFETFSATLTGWNTVEGYGWESATTSAADGQSFAIINGDIYQDLSTTPGQTYQLRYAVSGIGPGGIVTLQTYWGGNLVASTPFDTSGVSNENFGWIYVTNIVLATTSTTRLWFGNAGGLNASGPNLDDVSAVAFDATPTSCIGVPNGIIGWWKGQSNALDSVDGNHGILVNGTGITNGLVGQAFYFTGGNQCVQIPYSATLAASNYSIEIWVQPLAQITNPGTQAILFAQNNGQCQLLARPGTSGLRLALQFAVDPSTAVDVESVSEIPIGQFSHVAGTWDGSTLNLYVNGALDAQNKPGALPLDSGCAFYIGGIYNLTSDSCSNVTGFFNGVIDEVSYYRRALSDSEIGFIFGAGSLGKCGVVHPPTITIQPIGKTVYAGSTVTFTASAAGDAPLGLQWQFNGSNLSGQTTTSLTLANVQLAKSGNYSFIANNPAGLAVSSNALLTVLPAPPCVTVTNGLVSWWQGETNLLDGWDSNDGSLLPRPPNVPGGLPYLPVAFAPGKVGQAFSINTNGVLVADNISLRVTNGLSIEGWVNPTTVSGSTLRTIFAKFAPPVGLATSSSYYLGTSNGFLILKVSSTGNNVFSLVAPQPLQAAQWSHIAATYDGAMLRLYINGVTVAQTSYSAGIFAGTSDAGIGAVPFQQNAWYLPWSGGLDEISLYNRALSDDEILGIYSADLTGKCLVPPLIAVQPQSLAVPLNEDAIFSPKVLGSKPLRYQWRFNGTNLLNATGSRLALEHVQSNNVGNYSFIVTNTLGRATSSVATLTLLPPLSCVSAPTGMVAWWPANNFGNDVIGTNFVTLSSGPFGGSAGYTSGKVGQCFVLSNAVASAANSPELNIRSNADFSIELWYKGSPTNAIGGFQTTTSGTDILRKLSTSILPPTTSFGYSLLLDTSGRLSCQLAKLPNLSTNIPTFTAPGSDIRDGLFHHLAFTLHRNTVDGGRLYVDGQLLLAFDTTFLGNFSLSNSTSLVIGETSTLGLRLPGPTQRIDELTIYNRALSPAEILAIYQAGSAGKCIPPPTIPIAPTNQLVQAGGTARFFAVGSGFPPLRYQWQKNGTNIPGATLGGTALPYTIVNVSLADAGQYSVAVSNIGGVTTSAPAILTVNRSPVAGNFNAATLQNTPINIPIQKLLLFASDPDADPLSLASVATPTTNGGTFVSGTTDITYTPPNGYIGVDSSTYTVSDGRGGSASALINVQIRSANQLSGNLLPLTQIPGGFRVTFAGIPGYSYTLQRAESINGPWSNVTAVVVGSLGIGIYDDTNSPPPTAFYRTVYP